MLGAGTVINPIIKIVTTVAVLAAVYFFIVKPILDTTNDAIDKTSGTVQAAIEQSREQVHDSLEQTREQTRQANQQSDALSAQSYAQALQDQWPAAGRAVKHCLAHAGSAAETHKCAGLGSRLAQTVLPDRLFALSYADSLASEGDGSAAGRVRSCVKRAEFETGPMQRCRDLAQRLLFN